MATAIDGERAALLRAYRDQRWRLNNLYWIRDKDGTRVRFTMNAAQESLFAELWFFSLVLKARQLGMSTLLMLLELDTAIFTPDFAAATIAHNLESAEDLFERNIRFPFANLPEAVRAKAAPATDRTRQYRFANGSSIRVATSVRSGTLQMLHVSEFGKICAHTPDRAREIVTGSIETIGAGNVVAIESTAEGREGYFFEFCQQALAREEQGKPAGWQDWVLHFFPWYEEPSYRATAAQEPSVTFSQHRLDYFERLEAEIGQSLDADQRRWYVAKASRLGDDMLREYPSTPAEAFWSAVRGAYYQRQLQRARLDGRITHLPIEPTLGVETWWDLGMADTTAIWFVQRAGLEIRLIDFIEESGEGLEHYAARLADKAHEHGITYTRHYAPHDIAVRELATGKSRWETARSLGIRFEVVKQRSVANGIQAVRGALARCYFDESRCEAGLRALNNYRKEWDERLGAYKDRPLHNWASHAADSFRTGIMGTDLAGERVAQAQPARVADMTGWT